ncbi:hypothetical protein ONE63_000111 [Megalurothrips usitatus]|uniref:Uncharacterized protein n=1 Tax=Megalurothrips usitatus TaxID=439358 RepID=A0AAV7XXG4_9NEOP|nr:hypothetical protein ONE63_000111 [Megalurothrips usitatus]
MARSVRFVALLPIINCAVAVMSCGKSQFQCSGGQCVPLAEQCSGVKACADGSDESEALCSAANETLAVGDVLVANVEIKGRDNIPMFLLCDKEHCSRLLLSRGQSGTVVFWTRPSCNLEGKHCGFPDEDYFLYGAGNYTLGVERRASELAVWFGRRQPYDTVKIPARPEQTLLRVRPWRWSADVAVRLGRQPPPA